MKSETNIADQEAERWQKSFENNIEHEEDLFRRIPAHVLRDFGGQFVALSGGKIIDHDWNEMSLAKRVSNLPKDKFILIHQVTENDLQKSHN
jgi:hypothetical protein